MTIDEAIKICKDITNEDAPCPGYCMRPCDKCVHESKQLAEWLEELKKLREEKSEFQILAKDNYEIGIENCYNKAIDDFVKMAYEELLYSESLTEIDIDYIAEQLKEGCEK